MTKPYCIGSDEWNGLSKLIEENGEFSELLSEAIFQKVLAKLQITAGKLIGSEGSIAHWSCNLNDRLIEELGDLKAAMIVFEILNFSKEDMLKIDERAKTKIVKFLQWNKDVRDAQNRINDSTKQV